jgi:uncharacterized glyoxalase superfamily protein PhnB
MAATHVNRITPVLFCAEIEPLLGFWVDHLGFTKTIEVPHGNKLGFVALQQGSTELMYQTFASVGEDRPQIIDAAKKGPTFLYLEVQDLDSIKAALEGFNVALPERTAVYGMREISYRDPAGHFLTFAQRVVQ